jgi:hypothetical protein
MINRGQVFHMPILFAFAAILAGADKKFPEWRGSNLELSAEWDASPIVAVGNVTNITEYGQQEVGHLPWPMSPDVHRLFWCEGDFNATAVVKGEIHPLHQKYLWGSGMRGCRLSYGSRAGFESLRTRVWLLRQEGQFLRPTFDGGTHGFLGLYTPWNSHPDLPPREKLGILLLTPSANSRSLPDYAQYLPNVGDIACELLGKAECVERIRSLAALGDASLKTAACGYLKGQQSVSCSPQ